MKNLLLIIILIFFGLFSLNAQAQFNAGVSAGIPVGDASDNWTFNVSVDLSYLWEVSEDFDAGISAGYAHTFGDSNIDDTQFLPLAAAARYFFTEEFAIGADLGYAIGINDGNDGGFYYVPRVQYGVSESIDIVVAYRGVSIDGGSFDVITLGVEFEL